MNQTAKQQSKRQNKNKANKEYTWDSFKETVQGIALDIRINPRSIIDSFERQNIRSSHFSVPRWNRKKFVVDFCQNECKIKVSQGKLTKLWDALNDEYKIEAPCYSADKNTMRSIWSENRSLVFISPQSTQGIIEERLLQESQTIDTAKRLYQYLNWTVRINKMAKFIKCFVSRNGVQFMIIDSELHDNFGNVLYMFCIENALISSKAQKWQFVDLLTNEEVDKLIVGYHPANGVLPRGARGSAVNFSSYRNRQLPSKQVIVDAGINPMCYKQLKGIRTTYDRQKSTKDAPLFLSLDEFYGCIEQALGSNDSRHQLIPIVSILSGKKYGKDGNYSVDQVLPVQIKKNWVGVVYRRQQPVMLLFDGYDITNKAILCNPSFNKQRLPWFANNITKIIIHQSRVPLPSTSTSPSTSPSLPCTSSPSPSPSMGHTMDVMGGEDVYETKQPSQPQSQQSYIGSYSFINSINTLIPSVTEGTSTNGNTPSIPINGFTSAPATTPPAITPRATTPPASVGNISIMSTTPSVPIHGFTSAPIAAPAAANAINTYQIPVNPVYVLPNMYMTPTLVPEGFADITSQIPLPFPGFTAQQLSTIATNMGFPMIPLAVPVTPLIIPQQTPPFQILSNNQILKPKVGSL